MTTDVEKTVPTVILREIPVGYGLPSITDLRVEFAGYIDTLMGRNKSPVNYGVLTLMEYASAVHARGVEVAGLIHQQELDGVVSKGSVYYRYRTGELRDFIDIAGKAAELGSRRVTYVDMQSRFREGA